MLYPSPAVLPKEFHTATEQKKKKYWALIYKEYKLFSLFLRLAINEESKRVSVCVRERENERERERGEEIMSAYGKLTGDLFTSTVNQNLSWHLNLAVFIKQGWQLTPG